MATREEAIMVLRAKGYKGPIPGEQSQQQQVDPMQMLAQIQQPQEPQDIAGLFGKINPVLGNTIRGLAQGGAQAFGGISPRSNEHDLSKLYAQEAIKNLPQFKDQQDIDLKEARIKAINAGLTVDDSGNVIKRPSSTPGYFYMDESGQAHPVEGVSGMKPMPAGTTPIGQEAIANRSDFSAAGVPLREAQTKQFGIGNEILDKIQKGQSSGDGIIPGTTFTGGGVTVPLNPKLTESEQGVIGGVQAMEPMIKKIEQSLNSGVLESPMGDVGRTVNQLLADRQSALFTSTNPKLQQLQSELNTLKKTIPFTEGGKQLTETEKSMVLALLNISGKNNEQIMLDINRAMQILRAKEQLAIGGRNAAIEGQQNGPRQVGRFTVEEA